MNRTIDAAALDACRERFAGLVLRAHGDACWEWQGGRLKRPSGELSYGTFRIRRRSFLAHRLAWMLSNGEIPEGQVVRHRCDNTACVRPDHLLLGTQAQNLEDMRERGRAYYNRFPAGTKHPNAKMSMELAREIRGIYAAGGVSLATLGARFGLHPTTVHSIVRVETWQEAPDSPELSEAVVRSNVGRAEVREAAE
jgi:hypothetical protein